MVFFTFLSLFMWISINPCETSQSSILEFINIITERTENIHSIKGSYTTIIDLVSWGETRIENFDFLFQNGDLVLSHVITKDNNKKVTNDNAPRNVIEVISKKLNKNKENSEDLLNNIPPVTDVRYYLYKGKGKNREFLYDTNKNLSEIIDITRGEDKWGYTYDGDPRIFLYYLGEIQIDIPFSSRIRLDEFLKEEGPYYVYEKDGYTVLWHEISFDKYVPEEERNENKLSLEIWFDENKDIKRIRQGTFFSRSYGLDVVKDIIGETASCDYPADILYDFYYHDYKTFEGGVRIPLRVTADLYTYDRTDPRYGQLWEECNHQRTLVYYTKRATFNKKVIKNYKEIILHEEGLEINKPIPEQTFIAPPVTRELEPIPKSEKELKEYIDKLNKMNKNKRNYKPFIFSGIFVFTTIILIFITRRYFGWGI